MARRRFKRRSSIGRAIVSARRSDFRLSAACGSALKSAKTPGSPIAPAAGSPERGVDLILNPSASHFAFGKHEVRKRFVTEGSRAFDVGYVYANLLGNESGRAIYDGDAMIAAAGKLVATGRAFRMPIGT